MKRNKAAGLVLASVLVLAPLVALGAWGGGSSTSSSSAQELSAGGRTIGGPGRARISGGSTEILMDNIDADVCATVSLGGSLVNATARLIGETTETIGVAAGEMRALCHNADTLEIDCVGSGTCTVNWRVDSN